MKYKISVLFISLSIALTCNASGFFSDVSPKHQNFVAITYLKNNEVLSGFEDGTFKPAQKINRAETLKILILGSGLEANNKPTTNPFPDVDKDIWFAAFVKKGKELGVIKGTGEGLFKPERTVNKAEALKMLIAMNGIELPEAKDNSYLDVKKDQWYGAYFTFAKNNDLFENPEHAEPSKEMTRGELAELIYRLEKWKQNHPENIGRASYYANYFTGRNTASGEVFDHTGYTAAHQTYPFQTRLLVTNLKTLDSTVVRVTDRGPYAEGNIIDLTTTAFKELAPLSRGLVMVSVNEMSGDMPLGRTNKQNCKWNLSDKIIAKDGFKEIILDKDYPATFRKNEVIEFSGTVMDGKTHTVTIFFGDERFEGKVKNMKFSIPVFFEKAGKYNIGIIPAKSGESAVYPIEIFEPICESSYELQSETKPYNFQMNIIDGKVHFSWQDDLNTLFWVKFKQGDNIVNFYVNGEKSFVPPLSLFKNFDQGLTKVEIWGATTYTAFSNSQTQNFRKGIEENIFLVKSHPREVSEEIENLQLPNTFNFHSNISISGKADTELRENATLIYPNGKIVDIPLSISDNTFQFDFKPEQVGTYIVEINDAGGLAIVNAPIVEDGFVPLLPSYLDLKTSNPLEKIELTRNRIQLLKLINTARVKNGLAELELDDNLNALAQYKADDMLNRNYFSHYDPDGRSINDFRAEHAVKATVLENIAYDVNLEGAHQGLYASPIHRRAILSPDAEKLGIGLSIEESGQINIVELFSEKPFDTEDTEKYRQNILEGLNEKRNNDFIPDATLNSVAQSWTEKMVKEDFFGFSNSQGDSLKTTLEESEISSKVTTLIFQENGISSLVNSVIQDQITAGETETNNPFLEENWKNIGVGIMADEVGNLRATIIVGE